MSEQPTKPSLVIHSNAGRDKTRPPQKRLVGFQQYLFAMGAKGFTNSLGAISGTVGLLMLVLSFCALLMTFLLAGDVQMLPGLILVIVVGGIGAAAIRFAMLMFSMADEIEQVELITPQNTHLLPLRTTLVRASEQPATDPQNELLRAAKSGPETPVEELLRATQESKQDV